MPDFSVSKMVTPQSGITGNSRERPYSTRAPRTAFEWLHLTSR